MPVFVKSKLFGNTRTYVSCFIQTFEGAKVEYFVFTGEVTIYACTCINHYAFLTSLT